MKCTALKLNQTRDRQERYDKGIGLEMEIWCFQYGEMYGDFIAKCRKELLCVGNSLKT